MTWLLVRMIPVDDSTMPVPAAVPPWKPRIEFTSTTEGSTRAAMAAAVRTFGGATGAAGEGAGALAGGANGGTAAGREVEAAASLGVGLGDPPGKDRVGVARGACCEPPTTAYETATTRTTTASTMATTRSAAPVRRGGWGSGDPGGCQGPPG